MIDERARKLAQYIIDSKDTVRGTAKKFGISKSTVHKDVTERLEKINPILAKEVRKILDDYPDDIVFEPEYEEFDDVSAGNEPYTIEVFDGNYYVVSGVGVEKMMGYTNLEDENGFAFFQRYLREKGIIEALEKKGIKEGDTVRMYGLQFDYYK